ncbi:MAG: 50S ribosomal protein L29 [Polyangiaceae bacterium]
MKAKDLAGRTDESLAELEKSLSNDIFQARFKNFTNRLNDTASVRRLRRDLARVKTILSQRARSQGEAAEGK